MRPDPWQLAILRLHQTMERIGCAVWGHEDTDDIAARKLIWLCDYVEARFAKRTDRVAPRRPARAKEKAVESEEFGIYQTVGWEQAAERINRLMIKHGVTPPVIGQATLPEAMDMIAGFIEELDIRLSPPPKSPEAA